MLSRIFWVGVAGIALIAGIAVQDGDRIFSWGDHRHVSKHQDRSIDEKVERAIEGSFDKMQVTDSDGREVEVPAQTKRAMARAVGQLVEAEADLAMARFGDGSDEEMRSAQARRDRARADVDRLKAEIKNLEQSASSERDALREEIRREIREDVRDTVRDAVGG